MGTDQRSVLEEKLYNKLEIEDIQVMDFKGFAYKFSILIPIYSNTREIFTRNDLASLQNVFSEDFGGCTRTNDVTHPLLMGTYKDEKGDVLLEKHSKFTVIAKQNDNSTEYFKLLQQILEDYSGETKILIERVPIELI